VITNPRDTRPAVRAEVIADFASEVRYYLTQEPRQLPSRYLYDGLGSALFEAICRLPWYPLTRAELRQLEAHGREILDANFALVVELGAGSGEKLSTLIRSAGGRETLDFHLIDVSPEALVLATRALGQVVPNARVTAHEAQYEVGLYEFAAARPKTGRALALLLGSNIGNFDPPARDALLVTIRRSLRTGDGLLLGADLVKPEDVLLRAYDDPLHVTAAFNRNLLVRINRELGGNIDLAAFAHRAVWNAAASRVEMHLVSMRSQTIAIAAADLEFEMAGGETIWTESSYKFTPADVASTLERCGFRPEAQWLDAEDGFALTRAVAI
jgi:L-histidine Nalpha-methyltransferase